MEPCVFRMPFPSYYKDEDESSLLAHVRAFFNPPAPPPSPAQAVQQATFGMVKQFDFVPYDNPQQLRNFITNNLMLISVEQAVAATTRVKCLELLGKLKDVGMFEERSHMLVEHMSTDEIRTLLSEKAKRLREKTVDAQTVDVTPVSSHPHQENS